MKRKYLILMLLVGSMAALLSFRPSDWYFDFVKNMKVFTSVMDEVNQYYVEDVSAGMMVENATDAMLKKLDPYTVYYSEDEIEDYRLENTDTYAGIGAEAIKIEDRLVISRIPEGLPADLMGLKVGDEIVAVDGRNVQGLDLKQLGKLVRGQIGTGAEITYRRKGVAGTQKVVIPREKVEGKSVSFSGLVADKIGMIKLDQFTRTTADEVEAAFKQLKKEQGIEKLILDLRGNPGGLLNEAVRICNMFLPKGNLVVSMRGKVERWNNDFKTESKPMADDIPVVVLINGQSASASEIVSGVLQDYDRGVLVGKNSYGKGLVQTTRQLPFNARLKVTVAKYYTPSGRCVQAIDYGKRDEFDNPIELPDSLKRAFKTANGRKVYDGTGIAPDVEIKSADESELIQKLKAKGLVFDFATEYHFAHPDIKDIDGIMLSDADFADFKALAEQRKFSYTSRLGHELAGLRKEFADDDMVQSPAYQALMDLVAAENNKAFDKQKNQIILALKEEIAYRFFGRQGMLEVSNTADQYLNEGIKILNDQARYEQILQ